MRMGRNWMVAAGAAGVAMGLRRAFPPSFTFAGKAVLVTGASRGLGLVLSRELAGQGAQLAICARDAAELARARAELKSLGGELRGVTCGDRDGAQAGSFVSQPAERFG